MMRFQGRSRTVPQPVGYEEFTKTLGRVLKSTYFRVPLWSRERLVSRWSELILTQPDSSRLIEIGFRFTPRHWSPPPAELALWSKLL